MALSPLTKRISLAVAGLAVIAVLRFKPWEGGASPDAGPRETLTVGFLPVT